MPKRVAHLYEKMCDKELIKTVIVDGSRGKRRRRDVKKVLSDVDGYTEKVYNLLVSRSYVPTPPKEIEITDSGSGKKRVISVVPYYPDGIMHQLCVHVMQDVLMRGMYYWSCASIPGRGNAHAMKYVHRALSSDKKHTRYCAKMDIHHYYPTIDRDLLIRALEHKIKDRMFLDLIASIIGSGSGSGIAIGFYINQWLANFFLEPLDRFILTLPGVRYYVRNMDDLVLIGPNKRHLHRAVRAISDFLQSRLRLKLKDNWQVFRVDSRGIDFVGYRFYHTHITMRRRNFLKFTRNCRKIERKLKSGKDVSFRLASGMLSRAAQLKHCNSFMIGEKYYSKIPEPYLKSIIRKRSRELVAESI